MYIMNLKTQLSLDGAPDIGGNYIEKKDCQIQKNIHINIVHNLK